MFRKTVNSLLFLSSGTIFLFASVIHAPFTAQGQEALGVVNSNYAGVNGLWINPANAINCRNTFSLNLLAGDIFINSNYFFIHKKDYSFTGLFNLDINDPQYMYLYYYPEYAFTDTIRYFDYYKNSNLKNLYFNGKSTGPSLLFRSGDHAISILTAFRNNLSGSQIPYDVANFGFQGLDFIPQHHVNYQDGYFDVAMLSWIEFGAGYAVTLYDDGVNSLAAGISLKYLLGTAASYGIVKNINYMVPYQDTLVLYDMNSTFGLALPVDYATNQFSLDPLVKGRGFGGDIGFTFKHQPSRSLKPASFFAGEDSQDQDYRYRAGISLLDVGQIKFTQSVQVHQFENVTNRIWPGLIGYKATSIQQFFRSASYNMLGDSLASLTAQTYFRMWLPTALSLQFDYNFGSGLFLNCSYVKGIRLGTPGVRRETLLAVTPRYETPAWEVNLPVSIVDFKHPAIGLSVRIYSLVIGTEKLGTFINLTDVKGIDLYVSLGININKKSGKGAATKRGHSKGRSKGCEGINEHKRYQVR